VPTYIRKEQLDPEFVAKVNRAHRGALAAMIILLIHALIDVSYVIWRLL